MVSSLLLAKIFGLYLLILGLGMMMNQKYYKAAIHHMLQDNSIQFIWSMLALIFGLFIINVHNIWVVHWYVAITILGWVLFIKGFIRIMFPKFLHKTQKSWMNHGGCYAFSYLFTIAVGGYLTYMAFLAHRLFDHRLL